MESKLLILEETLNSIKKRKFTKTVISNLEQAYNFLNTSDEDIKSIECVLKDINYYVPKRRYKKNKAVISILEKINISFINKIENQLMNVNDQEKIYLYNLEIDFISSIFNCVCLSSQMRYEYNKKTSEISQKIKELGGIVNIPMK